MNQSSTWLRRLERMMFRARPALEAVEYDGWVLRFADGYTKRANSVNPHFGSSLPVSAKIAHCEALYAERGLPTIFRLTPFSQPGPLDVTLERAGYGTLDPTLVMTASLNSSADIETGSVCHLSGEEWFPAYNSLRTLEPAHQKAHRRIVESADCACCFAAILQEKEPIACGLGILVDDAVGLFDLYAATSHRRLGYGRAIVSSIIQWALHQGAHIGFLQVHSKNTSARSLYEQFGFSTAYRYWYRIQPEPYGTAVPEER